MAQSIHQQSACEGKERKVLARYDLATEMGGSAGPRIDSAIHLVLASALLLEASVARAYDNARVQGALESIRKLLMSLTASFSAMCSSLPALKQLVEATLSGCKLAATQILALVSHLNAPPLLSYLLVRSLSACLALVVVFACGIAAFLVCLAASFLAGLLSFFLTISSGILFSVSGFVAISGGMIMLPALFASGVISFALATIAIPYRLSSDSKASAHAASDGREDDEVHADSNEVSHEGFVCVASPAGAKKPSRGGLFGRIWKRKANPVGASLNTNAQAAPREGRAVLHHAFSLLALIYG